MGNNPDSIVAGKMNPPAALSDPELLRNWPQYAEFIAFCNGAVLGDFSFQPYERLHSHADEWLEIGTWLYDLLGLQTGTNLVVRTVTTADYGGRCHHMELGTFDDLLLEILGPGYALFLGSYVSRVELEKDPFWVLLEKAELR